jgi:hypothetical protein
LFVLYKKEEEMKVIKKGREQKGWAKEFTCTGAGNGGGGCGAVLLVEQSDVYLTHHYDYGGGHDIYNTFRCTLCGVETDIKESLPFRARNSERSQ